jgi:hypothetical protein
VISWPKIETISSREDSTQLPCLASLAFKVVFSCLFPHVSLVVSRKLAVVVFYANSPRRMIMDRPLGK